MSMEKEAIELLQEQALSVGKNLPDTDYDKVLIPAGMKLAGLESFQEAPYRHKGTYSTQRIQSFIDYVNRHKEARTQVFIDDNAMSAEAAFDHFDANDELARNTGWRDHLGILKMEPTPEWHALTTNAKDAGRVFSQREFLDFIADWKPNLTFYADAEGTQPVAVAAAYQAVGKLEIKRGETTQHEEANYRASRSKLEELDIRGVSEDLPALMKMICATHIGLTTQAVTCRLMVLTGEKPALAYRINGPDQIKDASAQEFRRILSSGLGELPVWMGNFRR